MCFFKNKFVSIINIRFCSIKLFITFRSDLVGSTTRGIAGLEDALKNKVGLSMSVNKLLKRGFDG